MNSIRGRENEGYLKHVIGGDRFVSFEILSSRSRLNFRFIGNCMNLGESFASCEEVKEFKGVFVYCFMFVNIFEN